MNRTIKNCCSRLLPSALAVLISLFPPLLLSSCGGEPEAADTLRVGVSLYAQDDTFISSVVQNLERTAQEAEAEAGLKINLSIVDGRSNQTTQLEQVDRFLARGYGILCVNIVDRTAAAVVIDKAQAAGVPLIFFNRQPVDEDIQRGDQIYYVGVNAQGNGALQGELVLEAWQENQAELDRNGDGYSWVYYTPQMSALYYFNEAQAADDWMISPPVNYEKGKTYELRFYAYSSLMDYPEALEVRFGTGRTPEELPKQLLDIPEVPAVDEDHPLEETVVEFTVEEDGVYHYAFHVYSPAFHEFLYLSNIRVAEKDDGSGIEALAAGSSVTIQPGKGCIHIANPEHEAVGVYSLNGVKLMESCESEMSMDVAAGIYLVNAQGEVRKVLVY